MLDKQTWKVVIVLALSKFLGASMRLSVLGYLPQSLHAFGIPWEDVGKYFSLAVGINTMCNCFGTLYFCWLLSRFDKRKVFIAVHFTLGLATLAFGLSTSTAFAIGTQFLIGLSNGLNICIKLIIYHTCSSNEKQTYAITYGYSVPWTCSMVISPVIGGALAIPADQYPDTFGHIELFKRFPLLLPNLLFSSLLFANAILAWYSLPDMHHRSTEKLLLDNTRDDQKDAEVAIEKKDNAHEQSTSKASASPKFLTGLGNLFKSRNFLLAYLIDLIFQLSDGVFYTVFSIWIATPVELGGLGYVPWLSGNMYLFPGIFALSFEISLLGKICNMLGPKRGYIAWSLILIFLVAVIPNVRIIGSPFGIFACCTLLLAMIRVANAGGTIFTLVFINNSVTDDTATIATTACQLTSYFGAFSIELCIGQIYAWSIRNKVDGVHDKRLGFPFDHYFTFYLFGVLMLISVYLASLFTRSINKRK